MARKNYIYQFIKKLVLAIFLMLILSNNIFLFAEENRIIANSNSAEKTFSVSDIFTSVKQFIQRGKEQKESEEIVSNFADLIAPLFQTLYFVGLSVAVGTAMVLGLKYMMFDGDAKTKADLKDRLIGFGVAVIILVLAVPIWKLLITLISGMTGINV